jgi:hypothetical protein
MTHADTLSRSVLTPAHARRADRVFTSLHLKECHIPTSFYFIKEGIGVLP